MIVAVLDFRLSLDNSRYVLLGIRDGFRRILGFLVDSKSSLANKPLHQRQDKCVISIIKKRRRQVLVPEVLRLMLVRASFRCHDKDIPQLTNGSTDLWSGNSEILAFWLPILRVMSSS